MVVMVLVMLILIGEGRNGKGTTFSVINQMLGEHNCSALKLGEMGTKESVASLVGKLANIDADTDASAKSYESDFRRITAGDTMMARRLYKDAFMFKPYVKLIVGANDLPHIADKTHGFYDRLIIIPYNVSFAGKEDLGLKNRLSNEISGILNWAIEGRRRLYDQRYFSITKTLSEYVEELKIENNPVEAYVRECIGADSQACTEKREVYEHYAEWCKINGHHPLSKIKFGKEFFRICKAYTKKDYRISEFMVNSPAWPGLYIIGRWDKEREFKELEQADELL
jgi:P4 family phage/plasmid primase-like protien